MNTQKEEITLKVYGRSSGENPFQTRKAKKVPAVVYGPNMKSPVKISLEPNDVIAINRKAGKTSLVKLKSQDAGSKEIDNSVVLLKEIQTHPYKNLLLHVDLHQIDLSKKIRVTVPLNFTGKAKGLAEGGLMNVSVRDVELKCLPTNIPNHLDFDLTDLGLNESLSISELEKRFADHKEFEFIYDSDFSVVGIVEPREEKAVAVDPAAAAAAAGPEAAAGAAPAAGATAAAAPAKDAKK